jgi:hypothetical protein
LYKAKRRLGRLQRQAYYCFIAQRGETLSSELAAWSWPEAVLGKRRPISFYERTPHARSIGARTVRRMGKEWVWRRD